MQNILKEILQEYGLTKEEFEKVSQELSGVLFLKILNFSQSRLNESESLKFKEFILEKQNQKALLLMKGKFLDSEWDENIKKYIQPLLESYIKEVLQINL